VKLNCDPKKESGLQPAGLLTLHKPAGVLGVLAASPGKRLAKSLLLLISDEWREEEALWRTLFH